jgi:hypothetical protein
MARRRALKVALRPTNSAAATVIPAKRPYSGILKQPMSFRISPFLERPRPYWYTGDDASWAADVEPVIAREGQAWLDRLIALANWHGVELNKDPDHSDCFHRLMFELAIAHVPGFAIAEELGGRLPGKGAPFVLNRAQTISLAVCVHDALVAGLDGDEAIAVRALSREDFMVPRRKETGRVPMKQSSATHFVKEMRSAWRDVLGGCASAYQFQVACLALASDERYDVVRDWAIIFGLRATK